MPLSIIIIAGYFRDAKFSQFSRIDLEPQLIMYCFENVEIMRMVYTSGVTVLAFTSLLLMAEASLKKHSVTAKSMLGMLEVFCIIYSDVIAMCNENCLPA